MTHTRVIRRVLLGVALTGAAHVPAFAADEQAPKPEANRPEGAAPGATDRPAGAEAPDGAPRRGPGGPGGARGPGGPGGGRVDPATLIERLKTNVLSLDLTPEQKTQVEAIFKTAADDVATARREGEGKEPRERADAVRGALQGLREKVAGVLSEEQMTALREKMQQAVRTAGNAGGRMREALAQLELSDEQKEKVRALTSEMQPKLEAARAEAQQAGEQARGKLRDLMRENRQKLMEILTPEQREKLRELLPEGGRGPGGGGRGPGGAGPGGAAGPGGDRPADAPKEPL